MVWNGEKSHISEGNETKIREYWGLVVIYKLRISKFAEKSPCITRATCTVKRSHSKKYVTLKWEVTKYHKAREDKYRVTFLTIFFSACDVINVFYPISNTMRPPISNQNTSPLFKLSLYIVVSDSILLDNSSTRKKSRHDVRR
jgi:hypothetical protein